VDIEFQPVSQAQAGLLQRISKPFERIAKAVEKMANQLQEHDKAASEMTESFDVKDLAQTVSKTDTLVAEAAEKISRAMRDFTDMARKMEQDSSARKASNTALAKAVSDNTEAVDGVFKKVEEFSDKVEKLQDGNKATADSQERLTSKVKNMVKELEKFTVTAGSPALSSSASFTGLQPRRTMSTMSLWRKFSAPHGPQDSHDEDERRTSPWATRTRGGSGASRRQSSQ